MPFLKKMVDFIFENKNLEVFSFDFKKFENKNLF
jgi:hypothetical protein